jgi:hypothetical protein
VICVSDFFYAQMGSGSGVGSSGVGSGVAANKLSGVTFRMEYFRIVFLAKPESFRMESFKRNLSEKKIQQNFNFQNRMNYK